MNIVPSIATVFTILLVLASVYLSSDHEQSEISRDKVSDFFCHGLTFPKFWRSSYLELFFHLL